MLGAVTPCTCFARTVPANHIDVVRRWETTTIMIAYTTPLETIEEIKTRVGVWMGDHSREWNGYAVNIDKLENQNAIHLVIAIEREQPGL